MLQHIFYGNITFIIVTFAFLLTTKTSYCDNNVGGGDAGSKANVSAELSNTVKSVNQSVTKEISKNLHNKETNVEKIPKSGGGAQSGEGEGRNQSQAVVEPTGIPLAHVPSLNPGALKRAFYVFAGLSVLVVAYLMFRSSRLRKSPAQMVRKYGVLAHKQDIEMRPLPLDEDDEDDTTVFDVSGLSPKRPQQQTS